MNRVIIDALDKAGIELKPGQIYWFRSSDNFHRGTSAKDLENHIRSYSKDFSEGIQYQVIEELAPIPFLEGKLVARRFNLGSLGKYNILVDDSSDFISFIDVLSNVSSTDDISFLDLTPLFPGTSSELNYCWEERTGSFIEDWGEETFREEDICKQEETCRDDKFSQEPLYDLASSMMNFSICPSLRGSKPKRLRVPKEDEDDAQDNQQVEMLEQAKEDLVKRITAVIVDYVNTTHQMPPMEEIYQLVKGKIVLTPTGLSRLVINENLNIYLPDYNELEVTLRPLPLTIYILFLRHLDGIVLTHIGDYAREMEEIYSIVMPNRDEENASRSISSLTDTLSGSLNQKIAIIKRTFKANILNDEMAANYYISGLRGRPYKISLPKDLIQLPAVFR